MSRLTLGDADATARAWFASQVQELGCSLAVDQMGNMFARRAGKFRASSVKPMIAMGSHLDTQPRGGRFDGVLGIVAALEVLRTMKESGFETGLDLGVVNWTKYVHHSTALRFRRIGGANDAARKAHDSLNPCAPPASGPVVFPSRKLGIYATSTTRA